MGTLLQQYAHAMSEFDDRVQKVEDDQWSLPTPCAKWHVRALVAHIVSEQCWAPYLLAGGTVDDAGGRFAGDALGNDPKEAWRRASTQAFTAFSAPGALERHVRVSAGEISARDYLWQMTVDLAIHAWDLAHAIGADEHLDAELVRRIRAEAEKNLDDMAASGLFAKPVTVPANADQQTRTLALFGRRS